MFGHILRKTGIKLQLKQLDCHDIHALYKCMETFTHRFMYYWTSPTWQERVSDVSPSPCADRMEGLTCAMASVNLQVLTHTILCYFPMKKPHPRIWSHPITSASPLHPSIPGCPWILGPPWEDASPNPKQVPRRFCISMRGGLDKSGKQAAPVQLRSNKCYEHDKAEPS